MAAAPSAARTPPRSTAQPPTPCATWPRTSWRPAWPSAARSRSPMRSASRTRSRSWSRRSAPRRSAVPRSTRSFASTSTCARARSASTSSCTARSSRRPPPTATSAARTRTSRGRRRTRPTRCARRPGWARLPASPDADFPEGFLFGSSTAAHQVEGGNANNDWWAWEHAAGTPAAEPSGDAIDQYHRYAADFALLAGLGQNAHRLSLEWSRIEPEPGEFSRAALQHYRRVLGTLAEHGLEAFVTLHHFTNPLWFARRGGWAARDAVERFERYCEVVARELGDLMPWACTINEPQVVARNGHLVGWFPPGVANDGLFKRVTRTFIAAHAAAVRALGAGAGDPKAGICLQLPDYEPARPGDPDCEAFTAEIRREC